MLSNYDDLNWLQGVQQLTKNSLFQGHESAVESHSQITDKSITKMILSNILTEDDYEDDDCLNETMSDILALAGKYGKLVEEKCFAEVIGSRKGNINIFYEGDCADAIKLNGRNLGGQTISAYFNEEAIEDETPFIVHLDEILDDTDYEDNECLEESREDIKQLASQFGVFESVHIELEDEEHLGRVSIAYTFKHDAIDAVQNFDGMVIGGKAIKAHLNKLSSHEAVENRPTAPTLLLSNILSDDDLEDEDCFEETKKDVLALMKQFGIVQKLIVEAKSILITFDDSNNDAVERAALKLNGSLFGGDKIIASALTKENDPETKKEEPNVEASPVPLYSGGKIIPEQYAACKRVPKIPNPGTPRSYAKRIPDENVIPLVFEMLGELTRLQNRSKDDKNAKARRRLVIGLREVARGIRSHKVKMVVMANNVDEYGALDEKLQDILTLANEEDVPVIFELNKRKLGKALGKTIKISVVGIQNADGAYNSFKKLKGMSLLAS